MGGQGAILCACVIGKAASIFDGKHATLIQAFCPEARGSACSTQLSISDEVIGYPYVRRPDLLVAKSQDAYAQFIPALKPGGLVLPEKDLVNLDGKLPAGDRALGIPATRIAQELGRRLTLNIVMVGFFAGVTGLVTFQAAERAGLDSVPRGSEELNLAALKRGWKSGRDCAGKAAHRGP